MPTLHRAADLAAVYALPVFIAYALPNHLSYTLQYSSYSLDVSGRALNFAIAANVLLIYRIATWTRPSVVRDHWQLRLVALAYCLVPFDYFVTAALLGVFGGALVLLLPIPTVIGIEGAFGVGVVDYDAPSPSGHPVIGRLFYPTAKHNCTTSYMVHGDQHGLTRDFMIHASPKPLRPFLPVWLLKHWRSVRIHAKLGAAPDTSLAKMPVVLFSHGLSAARETSSSLALTLASSGAVVLLVEHTDRSATLCRRIRSGKPAGTIPYDASIMDLGSDPATPEYKAARRKQTEGRLKDLKAAVSMLDAINQPGFEGWRTTGQGDAVLQADGWMSGTTSVHQGPLTSLELDGVGWGWPPSQLGALQGRLDLDNLILGGHSFGGCAALALAAELKQEGKPLGGIFTLDPAVDWVPQRLWSAIGYDGIFNDNHYETLPPLSPTKAGDAPLISQGVPLLNIFSESWVRWRWYQRWASSLAVAHNAATPSAMLYIQGSGHQGLCDLAYLLPHWINKKLMAGLVTIGAPCDEIAKAVNEAVLTFLVNAKRIDGVAGEVSAVPMTTGFVGRLNQANGAAPIAKAKENGTTAKARKSPARRRK